MPREIQAVKYIDLTSSPSSSPTEMQISRAIQKDLGGGSWIRIYKNAIPSLQSTRLESWEMCPTDFVEVKLFGNSTKLARHQKTYGVGGYSFSGQTTDAEPMPDIVTSVMNKVKELLREERFNMCLANWYLSGAMHCGFHSDDTTQLVPRSPIACVSWGADRRFKVQPKPFKNSSEDLKSFSTMMSDGDLVVMGGNCQSTHKHAIPKMASAGKRVSYTFRCFK